MTMTRFFTTYLYTPLAMQNTRNAQQRGYSSAYRWLMASAVPVSFTFLIAGIWHGAGWTFVVYGAIHGLALAINHGWREFRGPDFGAEINWLLTMSVVVTGLVVFRAPDLGVAGTILASMWGVDHLSMLASGAPLMTTFNEAAEPMMAILLGGVTENAPMANVVRMDLDWALAHIVVYGLIVLCMPTSQEVLRDQWVSCDPKPAEDADGAWLRWKPNAVWGVAAGVILIVAVASVGDTSGFLYYKF